MVGDSEYRVALADDAWVDVVFWLCLCLDKGK